MTKNNQIIVWSLIVAIIILAGIGFWVLRSPQTDDTTPTSIVDFDDCARAGYPVTESFPRQCRTPDGKVYVEATAATNEAVATGGCFIGGCSSQICSDQPNAVSTCEFRQEYACYQNARCERQATGSCGWTQTAALTTCINTALQGGTLLK